MEEEIRRVVGIIPARKESKRLPGKNMISLVGKPLIAYTAEAALESNKLGLICASSDDDDLLKFLNKEYGIMMIRRPPKFARDDSPIQDAVNHTVGVLELAQIQCHIVVILQANIALRIPEQIDKCIEILENDQTLDSCVTVREADYPYWSYQINDGRLFYPWEIKKPFIQKIKQVFKKQELERFYCLDGGVQAIRKEVLKRTKGKGGLHPYLGEKVAALISPPHSNFEVDTADDVKVAEALIHELHK